MKDYILLVEDNPDDADLTILAFKSSGIVNEVVVARDGAEALDFLFARGTYAGRDASHLPVVTILDLNLPKISGIDVLRQVRGDTLTKLLPVVILTTSIDDKDMLDSYGLGANAYVQKPVSSEEFVKSAGRLGLFWTLSNRRPPAKN